MARSIAVLSLVAVLAVLTLMHRGAEGALPASAIWKQHTI